jgi:hypothetical protein
MTHCLSSIVFVISLQFDSMKAPHLLGVFLTFVFGPVCCWLHSAITWKTYKEERKKEFLITFLCQITMSFISSSLLLICILFISCCFLSNKCHFLLVLLQTLNSHYHGKPNFLYCSINRALNVNCQSKAHNVNYPLIKYFMKLSQNMIQLG